VSEAFKTPRFVTEQFRQSVFVIKRLVPVKFVDEILTPPDLSPIVSMSEELIEDTFIPL
jgi:hypothetical protein